MKKVVGILVGILGCIALVCGGVMAVKDSSDVAVIGGADGPTSIFLAGKVGENFSLVMVVCGVVLIGVAVVFLVKKWE